MKEAISLIRVLIWTGLIALTAAIWTRPSRPSSTKDRIARLSDPLVIRNRVYQTDGASSVRLDVYVPRPIFRPVGGHAPFPAVLAIHGGSWVGGSKSLYGPQLRTVGQGGICRLRGRLPTRPARCSELATGARRPARRGSVDSRPCGRIPRRSRQDRRPRLIGRRKPCLAAGKPSRHVRSGRGFQSGSGGCQLLCTIGPRNTRGQPEAQTRARLALHGNR